MKFLTIVTLILFAKDVVNSYTPDAIADKVGHLPGAESLKFDFNHFSGYLSVQGTGKVGSKTKNLHYWFVESTRDASADPITFWTNGGPGCSGLIAFFTEQGPFRPNLDGTLSMNPYAWNSVSNMVFIESPTGVGFSYSYLPGDLKSNDNSTARDNYNMIQAFFERFPEYMRNSLYLSSESYGGHYIPMLAKIIVDENTLKMNPILNLKGIAIGNPYTDVYSGTPAMIETFWGHQLIAKPIYDKYIKSCGSSASSHLCYLFQSQIISSIGNLNVYALDFEVCLSTSQKSNSQVLTADEVDISLQNGDHLNGRILTAPYQSSSSKNRNEQKLWLLHHINNQGNHIDKNGKKIFDLPAKEAFVPCEDDYTVNYLANNAVKNAMHVKEDIQWVACSETVIYDSNDEDVSTAPIYNYLIDGNYGLDILIYSGDDDSVCATIGSQEWIWKLGYNAISKWQPYFVSGQTAGFITKFEKSRLTFMTVHGAGHEVPTYQPEIAFKMWKSFLAGELTYKN